MTRALRVIAGGRDKVRVPRARRHDWDDEINETWDLLLDHAEEAWCWRDPESLEEIEALLARLRRRVTREWST